MRNLLIPIFLVLLFTADAQVICEDTVERGNPLLILTYAPEEVDTVSLAMYNSAGQRVSGTGGFPLKQEAAGLVYAILLGIPSTLTGGVYRIKIEGRGKSTVFGYNESVFVERREFPYEQIALNDAMTDLLTEDDPEKVREARYLYALLNRFNRESVFHRTFFRLPVADDNRTSGFGDIREYVFSRGGSRFSIHNGIDFGLPTGTPVFSCGTGSVVFAGKRITTGNTIVIEHLPGLYSLYYHLDQIEVSEGSTVVIGDEIGKVGSTGLATGAHLHWEIRISGVPVNPDALLLDGLIDMNRLSGIESGTLKEFPAGEVMRNSLRSNR